MCYVETHSYYFLKFIYFIYFIFSCIGSLLLHAGFLQLWRAGATVRCGAWASHCGGFTCCRARAVGVQASVVAARGLSSCGARAQLFCGMWDLPGPGLEPMSPAFAGRFFFKIYLFIYLWMCWVLVSVQGLSPVAASGPLFIAVRRPLTVAASPVAEHRLQTRRLSSCGSRAQPLRGMWDLPGLGHEPVSPALAGGFLTTAPPGKPCRRILNHCTTREALTVIFHKP